MPIFLSSYDLILSLQFRLQKGDDINHRGDSSADITKNLWDGGGMG